jgi:polyphosphate kinase
MVSNLQIEPGTGAGVQPARSSVGLPQAPPEKLLFNRELSLVEFFRRVLDQARDAETPLLERLRFIGIFSNILDEFFMIRVSALKEEVEEGWMQQSPDGMTPAQQLQEIRDRLRPMFAEQMRCLREEILPQLASEGIVVVSYGSLSAAERSELDRYFEQNVLPVLTPLAVDPAHPFPYISGLSLNLGLTVEIDGDPLAREKCFVRLKVPPVLLGLVRIGDAESKFILLRELISANLNSLFPGVTVGETHGFRVTRDADIEIREDEAEDLLKALQHELRKRRFGTPVRLEVAATMPSDMVAYLQDSLGLEDEDVDVIEGPLNVADLMPLCDLNRPDLKYRPLRPAVPSVLKQKKSIFEIIKERDVLLHHPYVPYSTVTDFVRSAAKDPDVLAIKVCLYRTGQQSRLAEALIDAGERGKQVTALIELKARFDEENNIEWARRLECAGVHVVYGLVGLKTHCKLTLVVRREGNALTRYVHIATGNYNPTSSCTYTDLGLLTTDDQIGADTTEFFNYLTGYSRQTDYRRLLVAPVNLREKLTMLVEREADHARAGRPARIVAKLNRLADPAIIQTLYDASQAGVSIDLIVRGICMLRPGVPGLSENIRVRNIVGRFLEHSRITYFANGGSEEVYIGSADWMPRNLNRRVEIVTPVNDSRLQRYLKDVILDAYLRDNVNAAELRPDGTYERVRAPAGEEKFDSQMYFEGMTSLSA